MTHICERWAQTRTDGLQYAFFNGAGYESWENIWGMWNGFTPRFFKYPILLHFEIDRHDSAFIERIEFNYLSKLVFFKKKKKSSSIKVKCKQEIRALEKPVYSKGWISFEKNLNYFKKIWQLLPRRQSMDPTRSCCPFTFKIKNICQ